MWSYKTGDLLKEVNSYEIFYDSLVQELEAHWAEPVSHTCRTNQKQQLLMTAMFVNGSGQKELFYRGLP
jgi:hypothetical protein